MNRVWITVAGLLGLGGIMADTLGAHWLPHYLSGVEEGGKLLETWKTAARYDLIHAVLLASCGMLGKPLRGTATIAIFLIAAGVIIFSLSLYLRVIALNAFWGQLAPVGGISLLVGWLCLALSALAKTKLL